LIGKAQANLENISMKFSKYEYKLLSFEYVFISIKLAAHKTSIPLERMAFF